MLYKYHMLVTEKVVTHLLFVYVHIFLADYFRSRIKMEKGIERPKRVYIGFGPCSFKVS